MRRLESLAPTAWRDLSAAGASELVMKFARAIALLPLMLLFAACSADPSADDASIKATLATPTSAGLTEADQPPAEATPPADAPPASDTPPAPGEPAVAEPAAIPEPATSHVAIKYLIGDIDPANDPMFARIPARRCPSPGSGSFPWWTESRYRVRQSGCFPQSGPAREWRDRACSCRSPIRRPGPAFFLVPALWKRSQRDVSGPVRSAAGR